MNEQSGPFHQLSQLFVDNQRQFTSKTSDLKNRIIALQKKLEVLKLQLDEDVFSASLTSILNIEDESRLILSVAKEVEFQRDQVLKSVELLSKSREIKLNK